MAGINYNHVRYGMLVAMMGLVAVGILVALSQILMAIALVMLTIGVLFVTIGLHMRVGQDISQAHHAVGAFMRGMMDERIEVRSANNRLAMFQHRINNVLDVVDYNLRGENSGFDTSDDNEYLNKIKTTGLYALFVAQKEQKPQQALPEVIVLPAPKEEVHVLSSVDEKEMELLKQAVVNVTQKLQKMHAALMHMQQFVQSQAGQGSDTDVVLADVRTRTQSVHDGLQQVIDTLSAGAGGEHDVSEHITKGSQIMRSLSETTADVGGVIEMIHEVAGQTNMLALNATIEAARAGEAGRGFSVVASEVKTLASQTSKASEMVKEKVGHMQATARESIALMQRIGAMMQSVGAEKAWLEALEKQTENIKELLVIITKANDTPRTASDILPTETLAILLELSNSMMRDVDLANDAAHHAFDTEKSYAA